MYTFHLKRLEPVQYQGNRIAGFLEKLDPDLLYEYKGKFKDNWCGDVCDYVQGVYGGGKYQLIIIDEKGMPLRSKTADLSGLPILQARPQPYLSPFTGKIV